MKQIIWFALLAMLPATMSAQSALRPVQTVKNITVSKDAPYTDHIALTSDATDKDLMVKFAFDEDNNTLTVNLISYRRLFVFWDDTRYKGAFSASGKLHADKLPYIITSNPADRFRLSKAYRKSLPKPRKQHVFKKWIAYEGLQPVDKERSIVNDYIEQTFDILNKRSSVVVSLRDILLMDQTGQTSEGFRYELADGRDLSTDYQITIQRNPCFGLDDELATATKGLAGISSSYGKLKKRYGKGKVGSEEALKLFNDMKSVLTTQFTRQTNTSPCPDIQKAYDEYNLIVDSISRLNVKIENPGESASGIMGAKGRALNTKVVLSNARQLDQNVARWLRSHDEAERVDLKAQSQAIIKDTNAIIHTGSTQTAEERRALNIFRQAEQYFNKTCR